MTDGERDIHQEQERDAREGDEPMALTCAFCGMRAGHDQAIADGWTPDFWLDNASPADAPACPSCSADHLEEFALDPVIKPGHDIYLLPY